MTSIPSNLHRVPNALASTLNLAGLTATNSSLLNLQLQMSTMQRVNRPSDDPIAAALISVLDRELEQSGQRSRNLDHAQGLMNTIDQRLSEMGELVLEAKTIASSQVGIGSDAGTRSQQSTVINALIGSLFSAVNSDYAGVSLFSGSNTSTRAMESFFGGYRYLGSGSGLRTDLGPSIDFPITMTAQQAVGATSARVRGDVDLDPSLTAGTKLSDLRGPMADGAKLGVMNITIDDGATTVIQVDLSDAETIGDVATRVEAAIRNDGPPGVLAGGFGAGVTITDDRLQLNFAGGGVTVEFEDGPVGQTAEALGLSGHTYELGAGTNLVAAADLNPRVTDRTTFGQMDPAAALSLGQAITFRNGNRSGTVTVTAGMTVGEFKEEVRRLNLGIRVEIDANGDSLNVVNEVAGLRMSVEETGGGGIATQLGLRSLRGTTALSDFNDGRGVEIAHGNVDADGNPDASRNRDFEIVLSDGTTFAVDLEPDDITSVDALLAAINAAAAAEGIPVGNGAGEFRATLAPNGNGIRLEDRMGGPDALQVRRLNGYAAEDLGLLDGTPTPGNPSVLTSSDRATVRVDSLFSTLLDLREALERNDERGIVFAGERLEADVERLAVARGTMGGLTQRVETEQYRLEDRVVLDRSIKSQLQDLDFFEATSRFNQLETQLQASLAVTARLSSLSLLNFL
ncbi:MAG: hypothetical protein EA380_03375 [Phycisphaeraceae bacterium]|nr:MAG: hypothetical protein EA380_03375 [Phycisphaeraceae bacterium]